MAWLSFQWPQVTASWSWVWIPCPPCLCIAPYVTPQVGKKTLGKKGMRDHVSFFWLLLLLLLLLLVVVVVVGRVIDVYIVVLLLEFLRWHSTSKYQLRDGRDESVFLWGMVHPGRQFLMDLMTSYDLVFNKTCRFIMRWCFLKWCWVSSSKLLNQTARASYDFSKRSFF